MKLAIQLRAVPLFMQSAFEIVIPFGRTFILTHLLAPYEFGFASALAATFATFEQITDIALTNFVFTSPRSVYSDAIAAAHAVSITRGLCVGLLIFLASKPVACTLASCGDWLSFAWLAPATIINSFANLEIRVSASRDYRYWPTLAASVASHGSGLVAMFLITYKYENHYGYVAYLLVQVTTYVIMTYLLASHRYRINYRSPLLRSSLAFGLPLLMNGVGLAIMSQGDRWIVGSLLGLPTLGLYSLITLAAFVPLSGLFKITNPIQFAGLHNAKIETGQYDARLKLYTRAVPVLAALFALSLIAFYGELLPTIFGSRYSISEFMVFLLALIVYIRIIRTDPQTSLLFNAQNTRKLAIVGQAPFIGLAATAALVLSHPTLELALIGGLIGEISGLCAAGFVVRGLMRSALYDHVFSTTAMLAIVTAAGILLLSTPIGDVFGDRVAVVGGFVVLVAAFAGLSLPGLYNKAYGASEFV